MEKITLKLWSPIQAAKELPAVWQWIKAIMVRAGKSVLPEDCGSCGNVGCEAC